MKKPSPALLVDRVRQSWPIHSATLETIALGLVGRFLADSCVICLIDNRTGDLKMQITHDQDHILKTLGDAQVQMIVHEALDGNELYPFRVSTLKFEFSMPVNQLHFLVLPIALGANQPRGAILLARTDRAFSSNDRAFFGRANRMTQPAA